MTIVSPASTASTIALASRFSSLMPTSRLRSTTLTVSGGRPARATLATSLSTRRAIRRLLGRGPLHVDITASIAAPRATARVRLRAR